jgi:hypothetical protein
MPAGAVGDPPDVGDGEVNERVTVPAWSPGSGDSEVNARVNAGVHPSCHEPTNRPPESSGFRSCVDHRVSPLVVAAEGIARGTAPLAGFGWGTARGIPARTLA